MVPRNNSLERRLDDFHRRGRENIKVEMESVDPPVENFVNLIDVFLQSNALAHFDKVIAMHARAELRIVQQQVGKLGALLNQVQLCHALDLALELGNRNTHEFAQ